ncbi:MAG: hypothetical protein CVU51_05490 [Deltaproteobacteria bacterium HGW-Deltaproteobacteria-1]|jgi:diguanylate cyclase (GGDEF)-like protein/PAS domain S-box-containing protein|nr:MAG: hypothetical protein CVU51_05490 [Deltaproteobacteria bacterium HGW-Deltaproteobacteria-1]
MSEQKEPASGANEQDLQAEIARLNKIIQAMMNRSERNASIQGSDFNLFQTAVTLEDQVRQRTVELEEARLETEKITRTLRERENNYRLLLENSPMSIHEIDMDGRIISMSRAGILMHGLKVGDNLQGSLYLDGVSAADRERIRKLLSKACAGEISHFEFKASGPREPIFKSCFVPIKNKNGDVEKLMGITEDITERKRIDDKLRFEEQRFRAFVEHSSDMIVLVNLEGVITYVNPAIEKILGFKPEERIGAKGMERVHPDDIKALVDVFNTLSRDANSPVIKGELRLRHKDGSWRTLEAVGSNLANNNVVEAIIINYRDITDRKLAERYREMSNEILQILSKAGTLRDSIQSILTILKTRTGFDAVGIRLRDGNDFPYFAHNGFSNEFLLTENTLIERSMDGCVCRDKDGYIRLECTCGLVISGKTDPANPLFTKGGSAWTNDSFSLLDLPPDQDPRLNPRNQCIHQGYASLALVPIRNKDSINGLIQLNDHRKNCFSLAAIEQFESIAANIGEALMRKQAEDELKQSEDFLNTLINSIPIPVFYKDRDGRYVGFNKAFETFFGATKEQLVGKTVFDINPPELAKIYHAKDNELFESGGEQQYEAQVKNTFGGTRDVIFSKAALTDSKGTVSGLIGAIYDITERKQAEYKLYESEERYRLIAENTADTIAVFDLNLNPTYCSPSVLKLRGLTVEEVMTRTLDQLLTPDSLQKASMLLAEQMALESSGTADPARTILIELEEYCKDGSTIWVELSLSFLRDSNLKPTAILTVERNITDRKKAEEQIKHLATHDLLTDLLSLRFAKDRLSVALNMARRYKKAVAVMFIDLDGFKTVNDTLGHDAGDYVLQQVAQRMLSCVRETDTVTRVGGDEFLIIGTEINAPENAAQIAEKVIHLVSQPVIFNGKQVVVSASIGIALFPDDGKDMDQLIKKADEAMYRVKKAGKSGFCFINTKVS